MPEPRSLVRVLAREDELREATERAIGCEQDAARRVAERIEHCRSVSPLAPVVSLVRDLDDSGIRRRLGCGTRLDRAVHRQKTKRQELSAENHIERGDYW